MNSTGDMSSDAAMGPTAALVAVVAIVIAGLWSLDVFLARTDREAVREQATALHRQGMRLLQQHNSGNAVEMLRRSAAMQRDNREYQLDYVAALIAARKLPEADSNIATSLQAEPNSGPANLLAARLMVQEQKFSEAESHYHRAIYGAWPQNETEHRLAARLELARSLASRGKQAELLAELLPLETEASGHPAILKQIAPLYEVAGSPARGANVFRDLLRNDPDDVEAYAGLGKAELAQGNYRAALAAFLSANRRHPGDREIQQEIALGNSLAAIDPTPRHIRSAEKYARSMEILKLVRDSLDRCIHERPVSGPDELPRLLEDCDRILATPVPLQLTNELAEARLTAAEQFWQARVRRCTSSTADAEQPLRLLMAKLAHSSP